jgi:hypothetical protein
MDCEHFNTILVGALYDEVDELTSAAMKRHREGCAHCESTWSGLSEVHALAILPLEEPTDDLEARIFASIAAAQRSAPWPRTALRTLAWAGSQAMRPQLAAAAVLLLILGSSVLLLRPKPGTVGTVPVRVTEHGAPAPIAMEPEAAPPSRDVAVAQSRAPSPRSPSATPAPSDEAKAEDSRKERSAGGPWRSGAAGCTAAIAALDEAMHESPNTTAAAGIMWEAAECYRADGNLARAMALYSALRVTPSYGARAAERLRDQEKPGEDSAAAAAAHAAPPASKASAASKPANEGAKPKPVLAE